MAYDTYIFWYGRTRYQRREKFFEGLLELAEYLNDKVYGDGRVVYLSRERNKISFLVPLGDKMRVKVLRPAVQSIADRFQIDKISLRGRRGVADLETYIDVYLPSYVQDMTSLRGEPRRVWSLEGFIHVHREFLVPPGPRYPQSYPWGAQISF